MMLQSASREVEVLAAARVADELEVGQRFRCKAGQEVALLDVHGRPYACKHGARIATERVRLQHRAFPN